MQVFSLLRGLKEESLGVGLIMGAPKLKKKRKEKKKKQRNLDPGQLAIGNTTSFLSSPFHFPSKQTRVKKESKG